jgi:hypothetical protein
MNVSSLAEFDLGTKFSEKEISDSVTDTTFESSHIMQRVEVYYASREQLKAMGVPVDQAKAVAFPRAFSGFCKPPRE